MVAGALIGAALKYVAPKLIGEGLASAAAYKAGGAIAGRAMNFAAGASGQAVLTKVAGSRVASLATKPTGQFIGKRLITKDISQRLQGEGKFADPGTTTTTRPFVDDQSTFDPYGHTSSMTPPSGPTASVPFSTPPGPTVTVPGSTPSGPTSDISDRPKSRSERFNDAVGYYQAQKARSKSNKGSGGGSGFMGTGKSWWQQNEQVSGAGAFADPTQLGSFDVGRGGTRWEHPVPGRKLGQAVKKGTVMAAKGAIAAGTAASTGGTSTVAAAITPLAISAINKRLEHFNAGVGSTI